MPAYTLTSVRTADFTAADGTAVDTLYAWLDPFPQTNTTGYHTVISNAMKLDFSSNDNTALADLTGTYTNNQYVVARLGNLGTTGLPSAWIGAYLHCTGGTTAGTNANFYRLRISQDSGEVPPTTKIYRSTSGGTTATLQEIASTPSVTWANGDRFLFVDYNGTIEVYRDSGSGFGSTPVLTVDDTALRLTGGGPGIQIRRPDTYTLDDVEMGDATLGGGGGGSTNGIAFGSRGGRALNAGKTLIGGIRRAALERAHQVGDRIAAAVQRERINFGEQLLAGIHN